MTGRDGDVLYGRTPRGYHRTRKPDDDGGLHARWTLRPDRPAWHPDDCADLCCWNRVTS